ncbi:hypothetical protein SK128_005110 [Halocaridina rubra]|uniref:Uridine 5'-monophosphate synthase n=1 Tax=Halocaridina rubra TaxID=373956 RepID=A0AAN8XKC6_HALRR
MASKLEQCVLDLFKIGVVKFGDFTLKSGMKSPIYFDLRMIISFPKLMETVGELMWEARPRNDYDLICGVAYTGLPIATVISTKQDLPMLIRRKEAKGYGTKKLVEGNYAEGQSCLMIEDVIVSGSSVFDTAETLKDLELDVKDAVVFLDREQGGAANLKSMGINVKSVINMTEMMAILLKFNSITQKVSDSVIDFVKKNIASSLKKKVESDGIMDRLKCTFESRESTTVQPVSRKLFNIMSAKQSNLCVAADVTKSAELLSLAEKVGPYICLLKTHIDILSDFSTEVVEELKNIAVKHNFLIFEDRKFGDIGNTVATQYSGGPFNIVDWADLVTVHGLPGDGVIKGLGSCASGQPRGCIIVSQMSSSGTLTSDEYIKGCCKMAEENAHFVIGFVAQSNISKDPRFIVFTPGVQSGCTSDVLGQQYVTPRAAVLERGADVVIVGRGITKSDDPCSAAKHYKEEAFKAYQERITS